MSDWQDYLTQNKDRFLNELLDFLRIRSISSLSEHATDVQKAAEWTANRMREAGIENVQIMPTDVHSVVYGDWLHAPGKPTVMIYGHYDTQPVDPLNLWTNPPFEPTIRDGRIYARGASDDKGSLLIPILTCEAFLNTEGKLPINVKFFLEGQEEIGSPQVDKIVANHRDLLACDFVLSADSGQFNETQGALLVGLKGICGIDITVKGAKTDLHSGVYGGSIRNPLHVLADIVASMHGGADGKILVDGFYDDVAPLSTAEREQIAAVPYDEGKYQQELGVDELFGETGYTTRERVWARPTLELNGMWGGFQGEGVKTVLPNEANAKITCRLVVNQDPERIIRCLFNHVEKHTPRGVKVTSRKNTFSSLPYLIPADHPGNRTAAAVLTELYGKPPYYIRTGGSVPVCALFLQELGIYTVSFGFGLGDEQYHAPDEFFRISSFERGRIAYGMLFAKLAEPPGA
ncbi:MAG: dipeptidase [Deltaproteobacteria bacterium]|nr:dipeptidase [Deltaproteobacteria bacterium]